MYKWKLIEDESLEVFDESKESFGSEFECYNSMVNDCLSKVKEGVTYNRIGKNCNWSEMYSIEFKIDTIIINDCVSLVKYVIFKQD